MYGVREGGQEGVREGWRECKREGDRDGGRREVDNGGASGTYTCTANSPNAILHLLVLNHEITDEGHTQRLQQLYILSSYSVQQLTGRRGGEGRGGEGRGEEEVPYPTTEWSLPTLLISKSCMTESCRLSVCRIVNLCPYESLLTLEFPAIPNVIDPSASGVPSPPVTSRSIPDRPYSSAIVDRVAERQMFWWEGEKGEGGRKGVINNKTNVSTATTFRASIAAAAWKPAWNQTCGAPLAG